MSDRIYCPTCGTPLHMVGESAFCPRCTITAVLVEPPGTGMPEGPAIPGLEVHEAVGEGGFGIVYRATQTGTLKRPVALKILKPGVDTREVLRRFEMEQQALALLEHPNIARIYQAGGTTEGYPYFTMEFIEGLPVTEAFAGAGMGAVVEAFISITSAVAHAHGKKVLHRDLKPSNILVTHDGVPKVIDFGIAKAIDAETAPGMTHYTVAESQLGTPAYMAPEQADRAQFEIDERADIYSLGAILYEVLAGVPVVDATTTSNGKTKVPRVQTMAVGAVPEGLDRIVMKCLEHEREDRYESAQALAVDLRRFLNGDQVEATVSRRWGRRPLLVGAVGLPLLAAGGLLLGKRIRSRADVRHACGETPFMILGSSDGQRGLSISRGKEAILFDGETGDLVKRIESARRVRSGSFSPLGDAFVLGFDDGSMRRYLSRDGGPQSGFLDVTPESDPTGFTPVDIVHWGEGEAIYTASNDKVFRAWSTGGSPEWSVPLVNYPQAHAASGDGQRFAIGSTSGACNLIDLENRTRLAVEAEQGEPVSDFCFTRGSDLFATADRGGVVSIRGRDGKLRNEYTFSHTCEMLAFSPDGSLLAAACYDGFTYLIRLGEGGDPMALPGGGKIHAVAFFKSGSRLVMASGAGVVKIVSTTTGALLKTFRLSSPAHRVVVFENENSEAVMVVGTAAPEIVMFKL